MESESGASTAPERTLTSASAPPRVRMSRTEQDILVFSKTVEYSARQMPARLSKDFSMDLLESSRGNGQRLPLAANNRDNPKSSPLSSIKLDPRICGFFRLFRLNIGKYFPHRCCLLKPPELLEIISRASFRDTDRTLASALHFP